VSSFCRFLFFFFRFFSLSIVAPYRNPVAVDHRDANRSRQAGRTM